MSAPPTDDRTAGGQQGVVYRIRPAGQTSAGWSEWLRGLVVTPLEAGAHLLANVVFRGHYPEWLVVALTFGSVTAGVAGGTTLVVGLAVQARGALWRALLVAGVVALVYVLVGVVLDQQPGRTIGLPEQRNNHAMPKVTFVSDLVVGSLGAGLALILLGRGARRPSEPALTSNPASGRLHDPVPLCPLGQVYSRVARRAHPRPRTGRPLRSEPLAVFDGSSCGRVNPASRARAHLVRRT